MIVLFLGWWFIQADAPVRAIGEFSDMRYTEEHAYGYAVQLWRADDEMFGVFLASTGLAGDPPTGRIEDLQLDPATRTLHFYARLPIHGILVFDGTLTDGVITGEVLQVKSGKRERLDLCRLTESPQNFRTFEDWDRWVRQILSFRGPKPYAIESSLGRGVILEEATIPETWSLPKPISAADAARAAIDALESRRVRDIRVCGLQWIQAPLGAAIVLATGRRDDRNRFGFAVGIHDGTDVQYGDPAGKEFLFLSSDLETNDELVYELVARETLQSLPRTCR